MSANGDILWEKNVDYITLLRNMGCHFWAPLNQNDITEQLSMTMPVQRAGLFQWDTSMDAYKFKTTASNQQVLVYNIVGVNEVSSTMAYTIIADIYGISYSGTIDFYTCGQTASDDGRVSCSTCQVHRFTGFSNGSWHRLIQTVSGNNLQFYIYGVLVRTSTDTAQYFPSRPSNWIQSSVWDYTTIGNVWNNYVFEAYIKNIYMFDRVLTSQEINSLQYR
jgi:hypothetical protein